MKSSKVNLDNYIAFDKMEYALEDKIKLQSLEDQEAKLIEAKEMCEQFGYWVQADMLHEQLRNVWGQIYELKMAMCFAHDKRMFQKKLQRRHGDSKIVIVHEYDPYSKPPRIVFEIIPKHVEEQTSLALSHDDIQESNNEVVVKAPCDEVVEDFEEVVEKPCGESLKDLEEVVETICMEDAGSTIECFEVIDSHSKCEDNLQVVQTRKHEFVKVDFVLEKSPLRNYVHMDRFVEFNPTKIRGRSFSKKGRMQQVDGCLGNTSKLIFLVSLFNIWVWLIIQVRARALILTWFLTCFK